MTIWHVLKLDHDSITETAQLNFWSNPGYPISDWMFQLSYFPNDPAWEISYTLPFTTLNQIHRPIFPNLRIHFRDGRLVADPEDRVVVISDWNIPGVWFDLNWSDMIDDFNRINSIPESEFLH